MSTGTTEKSLDSCNNCLVNFSPRAIFSRFLPVNVWILLNNVSLQCLHKVFVIATRVKGTLYWLFVMAPRLSTLSPSLCSSFLPFCSTSTLGLRQVMHGKCVRERIFDQMNMAQGGWSPSKSSTDIFRGLHVQWLCRYTCIYKHFILKWWKFSSMAWKMVRASTLARNMHVSYQVKLAGEEPFIISCLQEQLWILYIYNFQSTT